MNIQHAATAGTMESSDAMVTVESTDYGIELSISSPVMHQFGTQIRKTVMETLQNLDVQNVRVTVVDRGALDCTLKARMEAAIFRAADASEADVPWRGIVK